MENQAIKPIMEKRVLRVPDDTWRINRIKQFESEKQERQFAFLSLKTTPLPIVFPELTRQKHSKCDKCKVDARVYIRADDWYIEPIDALMLKDKLTQGWFESMKSIVFRKKVLPVSMTSLAIHPAEIKMIRNLRKNNPEMPLVFVVSTKAPEVDFLLINYALRVSDITVSVIDAHSKIQDYPFVEIIRDENQIQLCLENNKSLLVLLNEDSLSQVLKGCDFGKSKNIFFLPVSINAEKNVLESAKDLGIVKINFLEPYTVDDLLKSSASIKPQQKIKAINKHLLYDVTMKRPVMSTNVVAFLMMTQFRDGATVKDLAGKLEAFRQNNHSIDLAFDGNAEDVVKHAAEILGERLVELKGDSLIPKVLSLVELSSYAEVLFPHFAMQSVLIVSAHSLKNSENYIDFNVLISTATDLCKFLESQIKFVKPCEDLSSQLHRAFDQCSIEGILLKPVVEASTVNEQRAQRIARQYESENEFSDEDDGYQSKNLNNEVKINSDMRHETDALMNVTMPIIEAYFTVICCVKEIIGRSFSVQSFIHSGIKMMREDIEDGHSIYYESCSENLMKKCINLFESLGIIQVNEGMISIHPDYDNKKSIKELKDRIKQYLYLP